MDLAGRLRLFPDTAELLDDSLRIAGHDLADLAAGYGTPLYLYDCATMDGAVALYRRLLKGHYPASASVTFAGKAFMCKAIAQWARRQHMWLDCTGETELAVAAAVGMPADAVVVHGSNKSAADLGAALKLAGTIVIDNLDELARLIELIGSRGEQQPATTQSPSLWLRLQPGVEVETHHPHTETGQPGSKFGMPAAEMVAAARSARSHGLNVSGLHFHLGSNFRSTAPLVAAIELALAVAAEIRLADAWHFSPGGGWGVAYHEDELPEPSADTYVQAISHAVVRRCHAGRLALPELHLEPGRSLVARAGVALYRIGAIKRSGGRTWIMTDGGMADNPRYALYKARYTGLPVAGLQRDFSEQVSIGGPYCESGDVILEDLRMPRLEVGELIAIPVSGAYQLSMSSNYNGARRPAALWLEKSTARLIIRRETTDDLLQRDLSLT